MAVPPTLRQAVERAQAALEQHPEHLLLPIYRQAIYRAFAVHDDPSQRRARALLAVLTARHVLPIWQHEQPDDHLPERLLATADGVMAGQVAPAQAETIFQEAWEWLPQLRVEQWGKSEAHHAGTAAVFALQEVLGEESFDNASIGEEETDGDYLDPTCSDTAMWAAAACAGPSWDRTYDVAKGREFWTWWLHEAIPLAWDSVASA